MNIWCFLLFLKSFCVLFRFSSFSVAMSLFRKVALTERLSPSLAMGQEAAAALKSKTQSVCPLLRKMEEE